MRGSFNGRTSAFQADNEGSIPLPRSTLMLVIYIILGLIAFVYAFDLFANFVFSNDDTLLDEYIKKDEDEAEKRKDRS